MSRRRPAAGPGQGTGPADGDEARLTCEETFRRLDDYVDRELSREERERVERHLASCAECAREYRFEASLIQGLRAKLDCLRVPSWLVHDVRALLDAETRGTGA